jgi:predicted HTH transcriptional regulator
VTYELPPEAVREAIVNAVAHRDYHSNASVEVRLFVDRLEIWNPGVLPGTLSLQSLHGDHPSVPANPLIAEPLYLARYIEKVGSGTQKMIRLCREAGLPEPTFEERDGFFVVSLLRDWLTPDRLAHLNLNERQMSAVALLKKGLRLTNTLYQRELGVSKRTATRDLEDLMSKGLIERIGSTGKGVEYQILRGATKGPKGP